MASGYQLDYGLEDLPPVDECGYPKHSLGVTEYPGLYVVGLPLVPRHYSSTVGGIGLDVEYAPGRVAAG